MKYKEAQSLEYKAQVPSFIRRMKGENVDGDEEEEEEELDEFGRSRQKRSEVIENQEEEDEKDPIKALLKDGAQIDNLDDLVDKPKSSTPPPGSPTQQDTPKKVKQEGVNFGNNKTKKRKTLLVDSSSEPSSSKQQKKKKQKQNKDDRSSDSKERILLDLQGSIEVETSAESIGVGNLDLKNPDAPVLLIGHHRIQGKVQKLQKPLAILEKDERNYYVKNLVYKTFLFNARPSY